MQIQSLSQGDPLEEGMATYSSILAWRIPWTEKPAGLHSSGAQKLDMTGTSQGAHKCHDVTQLLDDCCCFVAVGGFLSAVLTVLKAKDWPVPIYAVD